METVLLWRSGHCQSFSFLGLASRFAPLLPRSLRPKQCNGTVNEGTELVLACRTLIRSLPIPPAEFAFGRTRIFIRSPRTVSTYITGASLKKYLPLSNLVLIHLYFLIEAEI